MELLVRETEAEGVRTTKKLEGRSPVEPKAWRVEAQLEAER